MQEFEFEAMAVVPVKGKMWAKSVADVVHNLCGAKYDKIKEQYWLEVGNEITIDTVIGVKQ